MLESLKKAYMPGIKIDRHDIISKSASLDYPKMIKVLTGAAVFFSAAKSAIPLMSVLKDAAENYNLSESDNKDDEYITYLIEHCDIKLLKTSLEPVAGKIPGGSIIIQLIEILDGAVIAKR